MRGRYFQISLIFSSLVCLILLLLFFYRELFPEYKIYQDDYLALEEFRSSYTGVPPPPFQVGIKQILLESDVKGNPRIDRCTSCHVALDNPAFSTEKVARDVYGQVRIDERGWPVQEKNPEYIWDKLDNAVAQLKDPLVEQQLLEEGKEGEVLKRRKEAERLEKLKVAQVGPYTYDVTKVLCAHPLIGRETRPFAYHPVDEYGCTSCHNGNGRGLTTEKAHGPVFDGKYEPAHTGHKKVFLETDEQNDPRFAQIFNDKPGHQLLFQTQPLFVGALMEAKCAQCHRIEGPGAVNASLQELMQQNLQEKVQQIRQSVQRDTDALFALTQLFLDVAEGGKDRAIQSLQKKEKNPTYPLVDRERFAMQITYLQRDHPLFQRDFEGLLGEPAVVAEWLTQAKEAGSLSLLWKKFHEEHFADPQATGLLFVKERLLNAQQAEMQHVYDTDSSFAKTIHDQAAIGQIQSDVSLLTQNFQQGKSLYFSQACYACHRIAGLARGGIGPELTKAGELYPWYLKESIVWPQADLATSTMPNMRLDHKEVEHLLTFLLAQKGVKPGVAETAYQTALQNWEAGAKLPWEKPIPPEQIRDVRAAMTIFATEGCAACHRLNGFQSDVGFAAEKKSDSPTTLAQEKQWFERLFPEDIIGSTLVQTIQENREEIDRRIVDHVRSGSILQEIEKEYPDTLMSYNAAFRYATRAKSAETQRAIEKAKSEEEIRRAKESQQAWKTRVDRIYQMYMQQYGVGRLIGPRPNWSGVFRTDQWLMEHFWNPTALSPRSIMPAFPFDDTKFYSLTYMLNILGVQNRDAFRQRWTERGFNPEQAFEILCSQCHGQYLQGNGPVSEWIYPIPKNLRDAEFLRNLTREKAKESITRGVPGTPMPPWGTVALDKPMAEGAPVLTEEEIEALLDWIYSTLPGGTFIEGKQDIRKWHYTPEDILRELEKEKVDLSSLQQASLLSINQYLASTKPIVSSPTVSDLFDVAEERRPNGEIETKYYIKQEYYTPENLENARQFFQIHCAVCHGKEGDGSGERSGTMLDAKPQMLTNLDWILDRDDLRLLRSIKYGIPGTSMVAWGDQTTALKRIQLVMYVRQLSAAQQKRKQIFSALYQLFDAPLEIVHAARAQNQEQAEKSQKHFQEALEEQKQALHSVRTALQSPQELVIATQNVVQAEKNLGPYQEQEKLLDQLVVLLEQEKQRYVQLAKNFTQPGIPPSVTEQFLVLLKKRKREWSLHDGTLSLSSANPEEVVQLETGIVSDLQRLIAQTKQEQQILQGRIHSPEKRMQLREVAQRTSFLTSVVDQTQDVWQKSHLAEQERASILQSLQQKEF